MTSEGRLGLSYDENCTHQAIQSPGEVFKTKMKAVLIKYLLAAHRMDREWEARRLVNGAIAIIHT